MEIEPLALPSLPLSERSALPDIPAIYFAIGDGDEVLYIGKARRLSERWRWNMHHRYSQLSAIGNVRLAWLSVSDESLLAGIETACIEYFAPVLNRSKVMYSVPTQTARFPKDIYDAIARLAAGDAQHPPSSFNRALLFVIRAGLEAIGQQKEPPPPP